MKRRLMSLLLVALLVVSVLPVTAFAKNPAKNITVSGSYANGSLTSVKVDFGWGIGFGSVSNAKAVLQTKLLSGQTASDSSWGDFSDYGAIANANKSEEQSGRDYGFIAKNLVNGSGYIDSALDNSVTLAIPNGLTQGTYYVYLWVTYYGQFYPDALLCVINVDANGKATYTPAISGELRNNFSSNVEEYKEIKGEGAADHTHTWKAETPAGNAGNETIISCTVGGEDCDCNGQQLKVTLTASDVTLPGDVFNAECITELIGARSVSQDHFPVVISNTPGYKYSATGSDYKDIDPATFEPKQGYYQASIVVKIGDDVEQNLFVKYTATDPVVTAATGDERPIELMLVGMVTFAAMAAMAFVMDRKRRVDF